MSKLCILFDPDKGEIVDRVHRALIEVIEERPSIVEKRMLEAWVGGSREQGLGTRKYLRILRENLPPQVPVVIFPGNPFQVFSTGDYIIVPDLLNAHRRLIHFLVWLGKSYHRIRKRWAKFRRAHFPVERKTGYLVLSPDSSAGRKIGAHRITDDQVVDIVRERLETGWFQDWWGLYIEAGSGAKQSVSERTILIRRLREVVGPERRILTGGGIRDGDAVKALVDATSDFVVISTVLELAEDPKTLINEFIDKMIETTTNE